MRVDIWERSVKPFAKVFYACILVAAVGLGVLLVQYAFPAPACTMGSSSFPATICLLSDSPNTPWGIVTSMFVHGSFWPHYLVNMTLLFLLASIFAFTNDSIPPMERRSRQLVLIFGMFLSGASANVVLLWANGSGYGASGLVYAAWGITSVFSLFNFISRVRQLHDVAPDHSDPLSLRSARFDLLANLLFLVMLVETAFLSPSFFLSARPGVNVFVHALSFLFAFTGTVVWCIALNLGDPDHLLASAESDS